VKKQKGEQSEEKTFEGDRAYMMVLELAVSSTEAACHGVLYNYETASFLPHNCLVPIFF
jgi:hypothetical protein